MDIAFYSEVHNSGTSANMYAVAAMCSMMKEEMQKAGKKEEWIAMHFKDCGCIQTRNRYECMKQADLIVVNFPQRRSSLDHYFERNQEFRNRSLYLISEYCESGEPGIEELQKRYRIDPGRFGAIYYDSRFQNAYLTGKTKEHIKCRYHLQELTDQFLWNLYQAALMIQYNCKRTATANVTVQDYWSSSTEGRRRSARLR